MNEWQWRANVTPTEEAYELRYPFIIIVTHPAAYVPRHSSSVPFPCGSLVRYGGDEGHETGEGIIRETEVTGISSSQPCPSFTHAFGLHSRVNECNERSREGWEGTRLQKASSVGSSVARYLRFLAHSTSLRSVSHHFTPSPLPLRGGRSPGEGVVRDRRERAASGVSSDVTEGLSPFRSLRRLFPLASYPPLRSGSERNEESGEPVGGGERWSGEGVGYRRPTTWDTNRLPSRLFSSPPHLRYATARFRL